MPEQFYLKKVGMLAMLKSDTKMGVFLILLSCLFFADTFTIKQSTFSASMATATFFPRVISIFLAISSLNLILKDYIKKKKAGAVVSVREKDSSGEKYVWYMIGATTLYIIMIPTIGYLVSTIIYMSGGCLFLGSKIIKKRWVTVLIAVSISIFAYLLFSKILIVFLPSGFLI